MQMVKSMKAKRLQTCLKNQQLLGSLSLLATNAEKKCHSILQKTPSAKEKKELQDILQPSGGHNKLSYIYEPL
jgi:hypothetical protein